MHHPGALRQSAASPRSLSQIEIVQGGNLDSISSGYEDFNNVYWPSQRRGIPPHPDLQQQSTYSINTP